MPLSKTSTSKSSNNLTLFLCSSNFFWSATILSKEGNMIPYFSNEGLR
ncbi:hypothetical protein GEV33_001188 [Tenebrio molitor]|uniref:Uncharacterized protein n=1 Tax=Tenebrio molitor TaxID=7067 RepID=A0A8J6LJR5_TENMO|nr:hypothetical protein GEV33_001188 [Tenebrio molitor]